MRAPGARLADIRNYWTASGRLMIQRRIATRRCWWKNLGTLVRFSDAFREMVAAGVDVVVEIGPHSALRGPIQQIMEQ